MNWYELQEAMRNVYVPGTGHPIEWQETWDGDKRVTLMLIANDIMEIGATFWERGLFSRDDALTNSIRFAVCELIGDAIKVWQAEESQCPDCGDGFRALWDACIANGNTRNIPWRTYANAMPDMYRLPDIWADICCDIVNEAAPYYDIQIDYALTDRGDDYQIDISIGGGWQDMTAVYGTVVIGKADDLHQALENILPHYML